MSAFLPPSFRALRRYEQTIFFHLAATCGDLEGKVVIDIAGLPGALTAVLFDAGVAEVHGVNLWPVKGNRVTPGYFHHVCDARELSSDVPSADAAIAVCALEHLPDLTKCVNSAVGKLKPGGAIVMHGGPLWPCQLGHHLNFESGPKTYSFGTDSDPFQRWGHLLFSEPEMSAYLKSSGVPVTDADQMCAKVYRGPHINRLSVSDIKAAFLSSTAEVIGFTEYRWGWLDPAASSRIRAKGHQFSDADLGTGEIVAVARRRG